MTTYTDLARWALRVVDRQLAEARAQHPDMTDEQFHEWYAAEQEKTHPYSKDPNK